MSSLIPHDYRYKISSPTPVDKEPIKKGKTLPIEVGFACLTSYNPYHHHIMRISICKDLG